MTASGTYECTLKTPMGVKSGNLELRLSDDGETFAGTLTNDMLGTVAIPDGTVDDGMLCCSMAVKKPMKMRVECEMMISGDNLVGFISTGMFGEMELKGKRKV